jgi:hypothetical protein
MRNHRVVLPFVLLPSSYCSTSLEHYHASPIPDNFLSQTFPSITEYCRYYRDDPTSQFDDDHNVRGRIWRASQIGCDGEQLFISSFALRLLLNLFYFASTGFLPKLHIPRPTTQCPKGPWVTFWDSGEDVLPRSPHEDVTGSFPDYHASGEQDSGLDQDVATPTDSTAWSTDEELTPPFFSKFPRTPHPNALTGEGHSNGKVPGINTSSPIRPDTPHE